MNKKLFHKMKLGIVSLSVFGLLAACGNNTTEEEPIEDPNTEAPGTPGGEPAEDPNIDPSDEEDADNDAVGDGAEEDDGAVDDGDE